MSGFRDASRETYNPMFLIGTPVKFGCLFRNIILISYESMYGCMFDDIRLISFEKCIPDAVFFVCYDV